MRSNIFLRQLGVAAMVLLLSACASVQFGHDFDIDTFDTKVERNVTTKSEVKAWLGAPNSRGSSVTANGERFEKWSYFHGKGKLPNLDTATLKILEVEFDQQGIVQSYNWSQ